MITQLGAQKGLSDADVQKILDRLADAEQVAISVRNEKVVVMLTGPVAEQALAAPEPGLKTVPLNNGTILMGHADAVDQAVQRITWKSDRLRLLHKLPSSAGQRRTVGCRRSCVGRSGHTARGDTADRANRFGCATAFTSDMAVEFQRLRRTRRCSRANSRIRHG